MAYPTSTNFEYARKYEASPIYRFSNTGTIAAGAYYNVDFEVSQADAVKYLPFNFIVVSNGNASNNAVLYVNGAINPVKTIFAGTIQAIDKKTLPAYRSFAIKNVGTGTLAIGDIEIVCQREPIDTETIAQNLHRSIFSKKELGAV